MKSRFLTNTMNTRRFWKVVEGGSTLFNSIGYAELNSHDIMRFLMSYVENYYKAMNVAEVMELLTARFETELLSLENKRAEDNSIECFTHGMFYELGREGIENVSKDIETVFNYIESTDDIRKLMKRYKTGDIWDIASAYSFQMIEEMEDDVAMGTDEFDNHFKTHVDGFFSILDKELNKTAESDVSHQ